MRVSEACRSPREGGESEMRESPEIARGETGRKVREEGVGRDRSIACTCVCMCVCMRDRVYVFV